MTTLYAGPTPADLAAIPDALKVLPQWVLWRASDRLDPQTGSIIGLNKIPYTIDPDKPASSTDPGTWTTFDRCVAALPVALEEWELAAPATYRGGGIGFVFVDGDPFCGVDLDHSVAADGTVAPWAQNIVGSLASYTQRSVSGTGLHVLVQGTLPPGRRQDGDLQVWDSARFFAMTGWHLAGTPSTVEPRQGALEALWCAHFGAKVGDLVHCLDAQQNYTTAQPVAIERIEPAPDGQPFAFFAHSATGWPLARCVPVPALPVGAVVSPAMPDDQVLTRARQAANGGKFDALWTGQWQALGYGSESEADAALLSQLVFWTQDPAQLRRLFEQSALCDEKWLTRPDYQQRTLAYALGKATTCYQPGATFTMNGAKLPVAPIPSSGPVAPEPLRRPVPPAQPFPLEALGSLLTPAALAVQHAVQAPGAIVGQAILAAACLAVQGHADVLIDGRQYPLSEFFLTLAESGDRKSECDRLALRPHREWMDRAMLAYKPCEQAYLSELAIMKKERETILNGKEPPAVKAQRLQSLVEPEAPALPMLLCSEPTFQGLEKLYQTAMPSLGLFSDEGGRMLAGHALSEENRVRTVAGMSSLWDGRGINRVRVGDGATYLPGVRLAMHLMLQPIVAQRALADPLYQHQGFLGRCLMAWPASLAGGRPYNAVDVTADPDYRAYVAILGGILDTALPLDSQDPRNLKPRTLTLTADAKALWVQFYDHVEAQQAEERPLASVRSFASKAAEHALRLSGVLALVDDFGAQCIDSASMKNALRIMNFYLSEALRLHGVGTASPALVLAERLLQWLKDRHGNNLFLLQDVYQNGPSKALNSLKGAQAIMNILVEHGYCEAVNNPGIVDGKQRKIAYRMLPTP